MIISNVLDNEINNDEIVKYRKDSLDIYNFWLPIKKSLLAKPNPISI